MQRSRGGWAFILSGGSESVWRSMGGELRRLARGGIVELQRLGESTEAGPAESVVEEDDELSKDGAARGKDDEVEPCSQLSRKGRQHTDKICADCEDEGWRRRTKSPNRGSTSLICDKDRQIRGRRP
jgi:hypothetical protein